MAHWRFRFDDKHIGHWVLRGKDVTVEIREVRTERISGQDGTTRKPVLYFKSKEKGFVAGKTCCKTIERMYGEDDTKWAGKLITLYPTTVKVFNRATKKSEIVGTIRVRDRRPDGIPNKPQPDIDEETEAPENADKVDSLVDDEWKDSGPPDGAGVPG